MALRRTPGVELTELFGAPAEGTQAVRFAGAKMVAKWDDDGTSPNLVVNEFVATRLAMALGVPVPMGDAARWEDFVAFASAQIELEGVSLPPADMIALQAEFPEEAARIYVFDVFILNEDRHEENLLHHPKVGMWAIDHEKAMGADTVLDPVKLWTQRDRVLAYHGFDAAALDKGLVQQEVSRIQSIPEMALRAAADEARVRGLLSSHQGSSLVKFLKHRRDNIASLTNRSIDPRRGPTWTPTPPLPGTSSSSPTTSAAASPATSEFSSTPATDGSADSSEKTPPGP